MPSISGDNSGSLLRKRDYDSIVQAQWSCREELLAQPNPVGFRGLCIALLRSGQVAEAIKCYELLIKAVRPDMQIEFDFCELGAAHWLQGDFDNAISNWRQALKCNYGDGAKNMTPALILYYGSMRSGDETLKGTAVQAIEDKLKTGWAKNWPAPLGRYLVNAAGEDHVEKELLNEHPLRQPDECCRFEFYRGAKCLESGDDNTSKAWFRSAVDQPEQKTTSTEFVLARHELGETPRPDSTLTPSKGYTKN